MSLLERIAYSNNNPERTIAALRLMIIKQAQEDQGVQSHSLAERLGKKKTTVTINLSIQQGTMQIRRDERGIR